MMLSFLRNSRQKESKICLLCSELLTDMKSFPDTCKDLFHYKCLRNYADDKLDNKQPIICPEAHCKKIFASIGNKYKNCNNILFQNVVLSNDETTCCICFSKYKSPVASSDSCSHTFCCDCINKWCTFKHECPMDRMPIKMLLVSDFPGGHIIDKIDPPLIEQDLNGYGDNDSIVEITCEICNSGQNEHQLLLCDNCNRGYHMYCLFEPLNAIPEGDWFCNDCASSIINPQDISVVIGRQMPRGLGRVISNLEERLTNNNTPSNRNRIHDSIMTRLRTRHPVPISNRLTQRGSASRTRGASRPRRNDSTRRQNLVQRTIDEIVPQTPQYQITASDYDSDVSMVSDALNDVINTSQESPTVIQLRTRQGTSRIVGSLSSEIESDAEPVKREMREDGASTSQASPSNKNDMKDAEREIDLLKIELRSNINKKRHLIVESDSDKDDEKCDTFEQLSRPLCPSKTKATKLSTILGVGTSYQPSKSRKTNRTKKKRTPKKNRINKLRSIKLKKSKNAKKLKNTISKNAFPQIVHRSLLYMSSPSKLSILGRENQLPLASDSDNDVECDRKKKSSHSVIGQTLPVYASGSILTDINNRQINLRNMTLSNIKRLPDGTVIHQSNIPVKVESIINPYKNLQTSPKSDKKIPTTQRSSTLCSKDLESHSRMSNNSSSFTFRTISLLKSEPSTSENDTNSSLVSKQPTNNVGASSSVSSCSVLSSINNTTELISFAVSKDTSVDNITPSSDSAPKLEFQLTFSPFKIDTNSSTVSKHKIPEAQLISPHGKNGTISHTASTDPTVSPAKLEPSNNHRHNHSADKVTDMAGFSVIKRSVSPSVLDMPSTSQSSRDTDQITSNTISKDQITRYISRALLKFYSENKIGKAEFNSFKIRILDKIMKKDIKTIREGSVKCFVKEYIAFHLKKKRRSEEKEK